MLLCTNLKLTAAGEDMRWIPSEADGVISNLPWNTTFEATTQPCSSPHVNGCPSVWSKRPNFERHFAFVSLSFPCTRARSTPQDAAPISSTHYLTPERLCDPPSLGGFSTFLLTLCCPAAHSWAPCPCPAVAMLVILQEVNFNFNSLRPSVAIWRHESMSGNGLLSGGNKQLPEPMSTYHQ